MLNQKQVFNSEIIIIVVKLVPSQKLVFNSEIIIIVVKTVGESKK